MKTRQFPGVIYRDGPAGRRAAVAGGADVWEIVRAVRSAPGKGEQKLRRVADDAGVDLRQVRLAVDFYAAFPDEVDARITADEEAGRRVRDLIDRREALLSR